MYLIKYPLIVVEFYYIDGARYFTNLIKDILIYTINLLSIPLLLKTFFKPLKNEYHPGLVRFSIIAGIVVKTVLLSISLTFVLYLFFMSLVFMLAYLLAPPIIIYVAIR